MPLEFIGFALELLHFTIRIMMYYNLGCPEIPLGFIGFVLELLQFTIRIVMYYNLELATLKACKQFRRRLQILIMICLAIIIVHCMNPELGVDKHTKC